MVEFVEFKHFEVERPRLSAKAPRPVDQADKSCVAMLDAVKPGNKVMDARVTDTAMVLGMCLKLKEGMPSTAASRIVNRCWVVLELD